MGSSDDSVSIDVMCYENASFLYESQEEAHGEFNPFSFSVSDDEYIQALIEKENIYACDTSLFAVIDSDSVFNQRWFQETRLAAIKWVLNTVQLFQYHSFTTYISITYFHRFLTMRPLHHLYLVRLLSVACLVLAVKMGESDVPALSAFNIDNEFAFESSLIFRMELLVLETLEWQLGRITPFCYLNHYTAKFCFRYRVHRPEHIFSTATSLILGTLPKIKLMDFRPSVVAAAAVLEAADDLLTKQAAELKVSGIPSWNCLDREALYYCYDLLRDIAPRSIRQIQQH